MWKGIAVAAFSALVALTSAAGAQTVIRFGFSDPPTTTWGRAAAEFKRLVEAQSGGRIQIQLFPSSQLGNIPEMMENVRRGAQVAIPEFEADVAAGPTACSARRRSRT